MSTRPTRRPRYAPGHLILPHQRDAIMIPVHVALAAFERGAGSADHYNTLAAFSNLSRELSLRMKCADETRKEMEAGRAAVAAVGRRFFATGKFGLSGPEMLSLRSTVTLGDTLMKRGNSAIVMAVMAAVHEHMSEAA